MTDKNSVSLSKTLSWFLRHGVLKEGLNIKEDGYILVSDLLNHKSLKGKYTVADVKRVAENNDKQRFSLRNEGQLLEICANQGHSIRGVEQLELIPITEAQDIEVIHGTYYKYWPIIKQEGLNRLERNHIHFASGLPNVKQIKSGIRKDAEIFIYINLKLALAENLKFFKSVNEVILSPGNEDGVILSKYFLKVIDKTGKSLF